ncbi:MAG: S8 family peptidase [Acidimicrobiia bacterium]
MPCRRSHRARRCVAIALTVAAAAMGSLVLVAAPARAADAPALAANPEPTTLEKTSDLLRPEQWALNKMSFESVWDTYTSGTGVTVALIDTGVDTTHPDLAGQFVTGYDCAQGPVEQPSTTCAETTTMTDEDGHGTMSAGYLAAQRNNRHGIAGAAPGVKIMPIRMIRKLPDYATLAQQLPGWIATNDPRLQQFTTLGQRLSNAVRYAVDHGAKVISMSFGLCFDDYWLFRQVADCVPSALKDSMGYGLFASAVEYARTHDVVLVASAGNNGINDTSGLEVVPTSWNGVTGAGAIDQTLSRVSYSNAGPMVDFVAPGESVYTTIPRSMSNVPDNQITYGYVQGRGTSAAAPYVAAAAALVRAANPSLTAPEVISMLTTTAQDLGAAGRDDLYGAGLPNPWSAVRKARGLDPGLAPRGVSVGMNRICCGLPADDQDFTVTVRSATTTRSAVLDGDPTSAPSDARYFNDLAPGTYKVSVSRPRAGTAVSWIECTTGTVDVYTRVATVTVPESGIVDCNFLTESDYFVPGKVQLQLLTPTSMANDLQFALAGQRVTLDTDADPTRSSSGTFRRIGVGYRDLLMPVPPSGYTYGRVTCSNGRFPNSRFNASTRTLTILVTSGSVTSCSVRLWRT